MPQQQQTRVIDPSSLPRVSSDNSKSALKEECRARGLKGYSSWEKDRLLSALGEGTILLSGSEAYKTLQHIKKIMADEEKAKKEAAQRKREREAEALREKERKAKEARRTSEIEAQRSCHTHSFPNCHPCPLAISSKLSFNGRRRHTAATCEWFNSGRVFCLEMPAFSCEKCDFDVCANCLEVQKLREGSAEQIAKLGQLSLESRPQSLQRDHSFGGRSSCPFAAASGRAMFGDGGEEEEEEEDAGTERLGSEYGDGTGCFPGGFGFCDTIGDRVLREYDQRKKEETEKAKAKYGENVVCPPSRHLSRETPLKFTVWSSDGYDRDPSGFHRYGGAPEREFDSSWDSVEEANKRVEFVFWHKNPWGLSVEEMKENAQDGYEGLKKTRHQRTGLVVMDICPPDSSRWRVGGILSEAFGL
uniref:Uncharacterized protein n=1 Tax=Chromera velia CCMP2878 TaxID=1169474 RepID=A0A0G4GW79_9ALVE|eukprot:Cvel_23667.t1-p1 / transcript=Cvel_23667.t1 / gene=Cvel_23667 / organism=Chromera_velia_CCMP2878 / gene_product=hypothetical protein / transcript_product=hypothetical protein / location=Cvel_scaffold2465:13329-15768(+) / protein_length=416 / sequence_SO=supercontig / SO=protein_coding / is_pseudo=false